MKVRRRLFWAKSNLILKSFRTAHERDAWMLAGACREILSGNNPLVRKANRDWAFDAPCEIDLQE